MVFSDQTSFRVRCEWDQKGIEAVASSADAVIIVDVLSFSTCVEIACSRSAVILPYQWKNESAAEYARSQNALLAGPRCQFGEGLSLSPSSLKEIAAGTRLVLPSPNGSSLAFAAQSLDRPVVAGCLRNAQAVGLWASQFRTVAVIPAGERWPDGLLRFAVEDLIGAGAIIRHLSMSRSPESEAALAAFERARADFTEFLLQSVSGRELIERGFRNDVEIASQLDVSECIPVLHENEFVAAYAVSR